MLASNNSQKSGKVKTSPSNVGISSFGSLVFVYWKVPFTTDFLLCWEEVPTILNRDSSLAHRQYSSSSSLSISIFSKPHLKNSKLETEVESIHSFSENFSDIINNLFGILISKTLLVTSFLSFLKMNSYAFLLPLSFFSIISVVFLYLILPTSPMIIIEYIKVLNFLSLGTKCHACSSNPFF